MARVIECGKLRKLKFTEEEKKAMDNGTYRREDFVHTCYYCGKPTYLCKCGNIRNLDYAEKQKASDW